MPLDLSGFVSPEQNFGGLYKVSQNLRQEDAMKEQERRRLEAGKAASTKFLADYTDPEQFLTGTPQDDYVLKNLNDIKYEGMDLISKGVDNNQLMFALQNRVSKLSQDSQKLKLINEQKKQASAALSKNPAIDIGKFNNAFDEIYFETDETGNRRIKDISKLEMKDYATEILNTKPVFTGAAVDNYFKTAKPQPVQARVMMTDKNGGSRMSDVTFDTPPMMQPNIDPKTKKLDNENPFIPKYQIAQEGDKAIVADFLNKKGEPVQAELRLLNEKHFKQMMEDAGIRGYFMQQAKEFANAEGLQINDPKVDIFTRAIAYDYADNSPLSKGTYKENIAIKEPPAPKVTVNVKTGDDDLPTIDVWTDLKGLVSKNSASKKYTQANLIGNSAFKVIKDILVEKTGDKDVSQSSFRLYDDPQGGIIVQDPEGNFITNISEEDLNIAANKVLGVKAVSKVVGGGKPKTEPTKTSTPTKKKLY